MGKAPIRDVVGTFTKNKRQMEVKLSCGHRITRRLAHPPERLPCPKCPKVRGR